VRLLRIRLDQRSFLTASGQPGRKSKQDDEETGESHAEEYSVPVRSAAGRNLTGGVPVEANGTKTGVSMMIQFPKGAAAAVATAACLVSGAALAENPLGFYVGAGVGESTVRSDDLGDGYGYYGGYGDHHFAWKALVGIRPIPIVGAELEYIDFGHPGGDGGYYDSYHYGGPDTHPRAIAAFAVGHLPLPLPLLDVYAKAGAARLHTDVNGYDGPGCPAGQFCPPFVGVAARDAWDTRFAYGVGVQSTLWSVALRAEYERIDSPYGDPDLLTVGATWTF
jgi:hypothetical protein